MAGKKTTPRPPAKVTFADVKDRIRRPRQIIELVLDGEAAAQIEQLGVLLERLQARDEALGGEPQAPAVARELQRAEVRADASRVAFTLEAIPHTAYQALIAEHPASEEQTARMQAAGGEVWPFDPDTFAPALVMAQLIDPAPGSAEDFEEFWAALSDGQLRQLWLTALGVQIQATRLGPRNPLAAEVLRAAVEG